MAATVAYRAVLSAELPTVVVAAHCVSGAGSPPWGVYVLDDAGRGLRVTATLVGPRVDLQVTALTATGSTVRVRGRTYSTADVPRCCPDLAFDRSWRVTAGHAVGTGS
jgi:hypothetical protein